MTLSKDGIDNLPGAILAAGTFCFSPLIWQYAVTAEVFPLNTMLASILVMLTTKFAASGSEKLSLLGAFVCGLALCNQHTIILFVVPLVLWMLFLQRRRFIESPSKLIWHGVVILVGFSFYLYLPIAASLHPTAGSWGDVTTVGGFLHHFLRKDYGTFQLFSGSGGKTAEGFSERTAAYLSDAVFNQGIFVIPFLAVISALLSCNEALTARRKKSMAGATAATQHIQSGKNKKKALAIDKSPQPNADTPTSSFLTGQSTRDGVDVSMEEAGHTQAVLVGTLVFYFVVFHSLSNLPLNDKLLYGVHQRFWMQASHSYFNIWLF
jgi:4-amino-4-deoxy-L-arabinose transferase-like glycosyltransferase